MYPQKEQNGLNQYVSINLTIQAMYDCSEIYISLHQVKACLALVLMLNKYLS